MTSGQGGSGGVLRLRNLAMVENIARAEDPAWCGRLERQRVVARLGRMFHHVENPCRRCRTMPTRSGRSWLGRLCPAAP